MNEVNQTVANLNQVEGFEPQNYMRLLSEGENAKYYLDVVYRKLWFRLKHPDGKIQRKIIRLTDNLAVVEARIYLHKNDPEDSYIANAFAQKCLTSDDTFGNKYVELAETAAVGRALADAGFGIQFAELSGEVDTEIVDAAIERFCVTETISCGIPPDEDMAVAYGAEQQEIDELEKLDHANEENSIFGASDISEAAQSQSLVSVAEGAESKVIAESEQIILEAEKTPIVASVAAVSQSKQGKKAETEITGNMPLEQIMRLLTIDKAEKIIVNFGQNNGKTLAQIALERPSQLVWYAESYKGTNNLLRAGARLLIESAMQKAG